MIEAECLQKKLNRNRKIPLRINTRLDMCDVVFLRLEQVEDEVARFLKLDGAVIESSLGSEGLMEKSSMQTPPVAIWDHDGIERPSKAGVK